MRVLLLAPLSFVIAAAVLLGRATAPAAAPASPIGHNFAGGVGDILRVPSAATQCAIGTDRGATIVVCAHTPFTSARYWVVFRKDDLVIKTPRNHNAVVFSAHGKP